MAKTKNRRKPEVKAPSDLNVPVVANGHIILMVIDRCFTYLTFATGSAVLVLIAYWIQLVLMSYAGQTTEANMAFRFVADFRLDSAFSYLVGLGGGLYGLQQRNQRRRLTSRLSAPRAALEQKIDPDRTTSGLLSDGTTNPEDT